MLPRLRPPPGAFHSDRAARGDGIIDMLIGSPDKIRGSREKGRVFPTILLDISRDPSPK
jgi:hypothetical protein